MENYATKSEMDFRFTALEKDMNNMGSSIREFKAQTREDIKAVWNAINNMIFKVAAVVTICSTIVLLVFKLIEHKG